MLLTEANAGRVKTVPPPIDPLWMANLLWPEVTFYNKQREIIYSVMHNDLTVVPAGNELGKDFVAAFIVLYTFLDALKRGLTCRILTTSVKDDQLGVLWGEMSRYINTSKHPLSYKRGGPLVINQREIRRASDIHADSEDLLNCIVGQVSQSGEGLAGRHADVTLGVVDESSGVDEGVFVQLRTWADKIFAFGNCWDCENTFKWAVKGKPGTADKGGDILAPDGTHYERKVIKIIATDSPNVRLAHREMAIGHQPSHTVIVPGVKTYAKYEQHRRTMDPAQQCVSLDADWYAGAKNMMFPQAWLDYAENLADPMSDKYRPNKNKAEVIGVDSAQGGDNTCWWVGNSSGMLELISKKTPDTAVIPEETIELMKQWGVEPQGVVFDRGGGGREHQNRMEKMGYKGVRTVAFGESPSVENLFRRMRTMAERKDERDDKYTYVKRRAEMYHTTRLMIDPSYDTGFSLPSELFNRPRLDGGPSLREQLSKIPLTYDQEGRIYLIPKNKRDKDDKQPTLTETIGCSPDEADAFVLGVFGLLNKAKRSIAGAL